MLSSLKLKPMKIIFFNVFVLNYITFTGENHLFRKDQNHLLFIVNVYIYNFAESCKSH